MALAVHHGEKTDNLPQAVHSCQHNIFPKGCGGYRWLEEVSLCAGSIKCFLLGF